MKNYLKQMAERNNTEFLMISTKNHTNLLGIKMILSAATDSIRSRSHNQLLIRQYTRLTQVVQVCVK